MYYRGQQIPIDGIKFLTFMNNVLKDYCFACIHDANIHLYINIGVMNTGKTVVF